MYKTINMVPTNQKQVVTDLSGVILISLIISQGYFTKHPDQS